jgi:hypothetical protein
MHRTLITTVLVGFLSAAAPSSLLDQFWNLVASLWTDSLSSDAGCGWDPYGSCTSLQGKQGITGDGSETYNASIPIQNAKSDEGCGWDPNGGCKPLP